MCKFLKRMSTQLGMASALETLCGQAYGAKKYHMMGVYMQRSWIVLLVCAVLLTPMYFFAEDVLLLTGQSPELSAMAGKVSVWFIPVHLSQPFLFPLQRFLQCQRKNHVNAIAAAAAKLPNGTNVPSRSYLACPKLLGDSHRALSPSVFAWYSDFWRRRIAFVLVPLPHSHARASLSPHSLARRRR
jgi:hypothetical protein